MQYAARSQQSTGAAHLSRILYRHKLSQNMLKLLRRQLKQNKRCVDFTKSRKAHVARSSKLHAPFSLGLA